MLVVTEIWLLCLICVTEKWLLCPILVTEKWLLCLLGIRLVPHSVFYFCLYSYFNLGVTRSCGENIFVQQDVLGLFQFYESNMP